MTKRVRVENADTGTYKVLVQIWDKQPAGPDVLAREIVLDHPTAMTGDECCITSTRYLIVKEV